MPAVPLARLLFALCLLPALAACQGGRDVVVSDGGRTPTPAVQSDDVVDLTVYYRSGNGSSAYLVPVTREVPVSENLPRAALELLLDGPGEGEAHDLGPVLPESTHLRGLAVEGGIATVDLSSAVVSDASQVGAGPEHEVLALAAIANTLTEFPAIERVRVLVEGEADGWHGGVNVGEFWGGWGLPDLLVRDSSVVGEPLDGDGVPDLGLFDSTRQDVGTSHAPPVRVTSIRARDRTTYARVVVEVVDAADGDVSAAVPAARARADADAVVLKVRGVASFGDDAEDGQRLDLGAGLQATVGLEEGALPGTVIVTVRGERRPDYRLHALSSPTRIVLDVRK
jgi:hypothetical protein